jgi:hypothetical protein
MGLGRNVLAIAACQLIDVARVSGGVTERLGVREREEETVRERQIGVTRS